MATKYFVDTNILLRYLLRDNELLFRQAKTVIEEADDGMLLVAVAVVAEVVYGLRKEEFGRMLIAEAIIALFENPVFEVEDKMSVQAALKLYASRSLDFVDCYILERSVQLGYGVATQDKKLHNARIARD